MYDQEIGKIELEPYGAEETLPKDWSLLIPSISITGCAGRKGARCFFLSNDRINKWFLDGLKPKLQHYDYEIPILPLLIAIYLIISLN